MGPMHFLLQTLLLPLVLLSGHVYGEARDIDEAAPSRLVGEAIPGNSTDRTWNLTGPPGSRLHLNCTDLTLLKSANCSEGSLSIFENGEEEKICKWESTVYSRESKGNRLTVRIKTEPSTSGGRVSCDISLMKGSAESALTDTGDYVDVKVQNVPKTPDPNEGTNKKRIIGGGETGPRAYPFMAVIVPRLQRHTLVHCGGSILTKRHILTAAHCMDRNLGDLWVVVGTHNITDLRGAQTLSIKQKYRHPWYLMKYINDIAVLLLENDIRFDESFPQVQQVFLPSTRYQLLNNAVTALGWGETDTAPWGAVSQVLKSGFLRVVALTQCSGRYRSLVDLKNPSQICTNAADSDTCQRDSGGPLVIWDPNINLIVQVGLITDKFDCVNRVVPRLNTEVFPHVDWIERKVSEYVPNPNRPLERLTCKKYHQFLVPNYQKLGLGNYNDYCIYS